VVVCVCVGAVAVLSDPRRFGAGDEVCRRGGWGACTAERRPGVLPDGIAGDDGRRGRREPRRVRPITSLSSAVGGVVARHLCPLAGRVACSPA